MTFPFHRWSPKTRLAAFVLALFLVCIWTLTWNAIRMLHRDMQRVLSEQQFSTVTLAAAEINDDLCDRLRALQTVAGEIPPDSMASSPLLSDYLGRRTTFQSLFNAGTFITDTRGNPVADCPPGAGRLGPAVNSHDYLAATLLKGQPVVGRPILDSSLRATVFCIAVPIHDRQGSVIGALAGKISLGLPCFLDRITSLHYGKTGGYLIVDPQHRVIVTGTDKRRILEPSPAPGVFPLIDRFLSGYEGSGIGVNPVGVEVLASAKGIPVAGWYVNTAIPTAEAFAPLHSLQRNMVLGAGIASLLAMLLIWRIILSQHLTRVLQSQVDEKTSALQTSERRFRTVVEGSNDLIYTLSPDGIITYIAPNVTTILGYQPELLIGGSFQPFIHPEDLPACMSFLQQVMTTGWKNEGLECRIRHQNGDWRWFTSNASLVTDVTGNPAFLGIGRDIDERKQMELALRESEATHRVLLEESADAIFSLTPEGRYRYVNLAFARHLGLSPRDLIGRTLWDAFPKAEADKRFAALTRVCQSGETGILEVAIPTPAGMRYFMTTIVPVKDTTGVTLAICSAKDVTPLKTTENALREASTRLEQQQVALRQSNELLEQRVAARTRELTDEHQRLTGIIEGTHVGTWEWNVPTGELVCNERWAGIIGYTLAELAPITHQTWTSAIHPDDLPTCRELLEKQKDLDAVVSVAAPA